MKKSRFTETQISQALKEHEAGKKASDICRELSISPNPPLPHDCIVWLGATGDASDRSCSRCVGDEK